MKHYLECNNPSCKFVLDVRLNGRATAPRGPLLDHCPQCGAKWSTARPVSGRSLGAERLAKLPYCPCCRREAPAKVALGLHHPA